MKHLRIYEDFRDIKVDDVVVALYTLPKNKNGYELKAGNKYKILQIDNGSYAEVEELDGTYQGFYNIVRFLPELEYNANKYNL